MIPSLPGDSPRSPGTKRVPQIGPQSLGTSGDLPRLLSPSTFYILLTEIAVSCIFILMKVVQIYKCLCDELRLRILHLLQEGPLCVCHFVEILGCEQVKMSKQLRYMKELGMLESERQAQWIIYRLACPDHPLLRENLQCLQDCASTELPFRQDRRKRREVIRRLRSQPSVCAERLLQKQTPSCC
jgi:ArsR family transcriptional regulator